jgi:hypothetical protein
MTTILMIIITIIKLKGIIIRIIINRFYQDYETRNTGNKNVS